MMTLFNTKAPMAVGIVGLSLMAGFASASEITNPNDEMNKHFAIASERYDDNEVQFHSRQDGADGSRNKVYTFNCAERLYKEVFDGEAPPENFPVDPQGSSTEPFDKNSTVAPLAAHACEQHGVPLLGFEW